MNNFKISIKKPTSFFAKKGERYAFCTCGYSTKMPLCDGAHKEHAPAYRSLKFESNYDQEIWLCDGLSHDDPRIIKNKPKETENT